MEVILVTGLVVSAGNRCLAQERRGVPSFDRAPTASESAVHDSKDQKASTVATSAGASARTTIINRRSKNTVAVGSGSNERPAVELPERGSRIPIRRIHQPGTEEILQVQALELNNNPTLKRARSAVLERESELSSPNGSKTGTQPAVPDPSDDELPRVSDASVSSASRGTRKSAVVTVSIRANVELDSRVIRLSDIATLTGTDAVLKNQLKQLDLEDGLTPGETVTILPPQIEFRMRLAGIDVDKVSIKGNGARVSTQPSVVVRSSDQVTGAAATSWRDGARQRSLDAVDVTDDTGPLEREIIRAAKAHVLDKLPWSPDDVEIHLAMPISSEIRLVESATGYVCHTELRTTGPLLGRVHLRVVANARQKPTFDVPVVLDVRHFDQVVMTTKSIDRGHVLTAADLYVDRRDVSELTEYCSSTKELLGNATKRSFRALLPIRVSDVETAVRGDNTPVIKRRDQVRMVARVGSLNVSATGEALQDGRMGETIRLRNVDSNTQVQGRVTGRGEVEILF
jgi:flagella basal body P-ring formation protein FlgA